MYLSFNKSINQSSKIVIQKFYKWILSSFILQYRENSETGLKVLHGFLKKSLLQWPLYPLYINLIFITLYHVLYSNYHFLDRVSLWPILLPSLTSFEYFTSLLHWKLMKSIFNNLSLTQNLLFFKLFHQMKKFVNTLEKPWVTLKTLFSYVLPFVTFLT